MAKNIITDLCRLSAVLIVYFFLQIFVWQCVYYICICVYYFNREIIYAYNISSLILLCLALKLSILSEFIIMWQNKCCVNFSCLCVNIWNRYYKNNWISPYTYPILLKDMWKKCCFDIILFLLAFPDFPSPLWLFSVKFLEIKLKVA